MKLGDLKKPLDIESVDFRIQSINKGGYATILAYKNARVDMERLDDVCGPENWQRDHREIKGNIYCGIGIKVGDDWVWKWDAGAESFSDKEKGEASDSFKRAGFNWNIGRELYRFPTIQVKLNSEEFKEENGRAKQTWNLKLKEWEWNIIYEDSEITGLIAFDQKDIARYIHAEDLKTLEKIWNLYPEKQKDVAFKNIVSTKKTKIK